MKVRRVNDRSVLTVTASSSNPGLIPNPTVNYTSPQSTGTLTYTPVANEIGRATCRETVTDAATAGGPAISVSQMFTVTVTAVNDAPTLAPIPNPAAILEDATQASVMVR